MDHESIIVEERKTKQLYLRDEIIHGGFDPLIFKAYLDHLKADGGSNVDLWTMQELENAVSQFKIYHMNNNNPTYHDQMNPNQEPNNIHYDQENQENHGNLEHNENLEHHENSENHIPDLVKKNTFFLYQEEHNGINTKEEIPFKKLVDAKQIEGSILNQVSNIQIDVSEPIIVKGGIFSISYVSYKITTSPWNWTVRRRYSDFYWLRGILTKLYPGIILPPIPNKKVRRSLEDNFIARRRDFLQRFLRNCVLSEDIKNCEYLYYFLTVEDENTWNAWKKEGDKVAKISALQNVRALNAKVELEVNDDLNLFANKANNFVNQANPLYQKLRGYSKQLMIDFNQISDTMKNIGECFGDLYQASNDFNKAVTIGANPMLEDIYLSLNNLFMSWGDTMLEKLKHIQNELCNFFKYEHFEIKVIKDVLKARNTAENDYLKNKNDLLAKKLKLFELGDYTKWEIPVTKLEQLDREELVKNKLMAFDIMLPNETLNVEQLREYFAYLNKKTYVETERVFATKNKEYAKNFIEFTKNQADKLAIANQHLFKCLAYMTESGGVNYIKNDDLLITKTSFIKQNQDLNNGLIVDSSPIDDNNNSNPPIAPNNGQ